MSADARDLRKLLQAIESLRTQIERLSDRVAILEGPPQRELISTSPNNRPAFGTPVTDEALLCIIGAAVAAYLGVQPRIRQIRLVGGSSWAQQGRVTIQASHALPIRHG
jgi:methylmalonyl-CoA carboxyltransferase large subunit